ncbi:hypothetical protein [Aerococcus sp. UMB7834]|uniref:hypothetical protein n=1 Tax=Aerococcus sp. UMB7834 TaxID=3046342 RepID=UPI00254FEEF8|nr:hypothetical protein [Aerococcus sp. UMB7834]MDK6804428.1 hypothetical protein [Aerococcus sp. UMB7834]
MGQIILIYALVLFTYINYFYFWRIRGLGFKCKNFELNIQSLKNNINLLINFAIILVIFGFGIMFIFMYNTSHLLIFLCTNCFIWIIYLFFIENAPGNLVKTIAPRFYTLSKLEKIVISAVTIPYFLLALEFGNYELNDYSKLNFFILSNRTEQVVDQSTILIEPTPTKLINKRSDPSDINYSILTLESEGKTYQVRVPYQFNENMVLNHFYFILFLYSILYLLPKLGRFITVILYNIILEDNKTSFIYTKLSPLHIPKHYNLPGKIYFLIPDRKKTIDLILTDSESSPK